MAALYNIRHSNATRYKSDYLMFFGFAALLLLESVKMAPLYHYAVPLLDAGFVIICLVFIIVSIASLRKGRSDRIHKKTEVFNKASYTMESIDPPYSYMKKEFIEIDLEEPDGTSFFVNKNAINYTAAIVLSIALLIGGVNLFGSRPEARPVYQIDYAGGAIPIGDLPIGARVVDPSWEWEYRLGVDYTNYNYSGDPIPPGKVQPVTWIVVANDHYEDLDPHVTLLSEELIGWFTFDDSTDRGSSGGNNHWGESGTGKASHGLRPWLNSTGIYSGEGFYRAFSESFKWAVLTTTVPNKESQYGSAYSTSDHVFVPSTTELGDTDHIRTDPIGTVYPYFQEEFRGESNQKRLPIFEGDKRSFRGYWTRSPDSSSFIASRVRYVSYAGSFHGGYASSGYGVYDGVRPALNLKSETLVAEIND